MVINIKFRLRRAVCEMVSGDRILNFTIPYQYVIITICPYENTLYHNVCDKANFVGLFIYLEIKHQHLEPISDNFAHRWSRLVLVLTII